MSRNATKYYHQFHFKCYHPDVIKINVMKNLSILHADISWYVMTCHDLVYLIQRVQILSGDFVRIARFFPKRKGTSKRENCTICNAVQKLT